MAVIKFASKDGRGIKAHDVCTLTVHLAQLAYKLEVQKLARTPIFEPLPCQLFAQDGNRMVARELHFR